jgi:hypothetical protein
VRPVRAQPASAEPADRVADPACRAKFSDGGTEGVIERGVKTGVVSAVSGIDAVSVFIRAIRVSRVLAAWTRTILPMLACLLEGGGLFFVD